MFGSAWCADLGCLDPLAAFDWVFSRPMVSCALCYHLEMYSAYMFAEVRTCWADFMEGSSRLELLLRMAPLKCVIDGVNDSSSLLFFFFFSFLPSLLPLPVS